jgi:hypothetical protein
MIHEFTDRIRIEVMEMKRRGTLRAVFVLFVPSW